MSGLTVVRTYALAKGSGDAEGAIATFADDIVMETIPFHLDARGVGEAAAQVHAWLSAFPDYRVDVEAFAENGDAVAAWGAISATMRGSFAGVPATGGRFHLPFSCVWNTAGGRITRERFFFDFSSMCDQLRIPATQMREVLNSARARYESARLTVVTPAS